MKNVKNKAIGSLVVLGMTGGMMTPVYAEENKDVVNLRIAGTTDIHSALHNYDYYQDIETKNGGMVKVATLIKQAKAEVDKSSKDEIDNFLLVDAGDIIQGNPLGDYYSQNPIDKSHPVFKTMEHLQYDAVALGNHEFNYGLDFIKDAVKTTTGDFLISSNVYDMEGNPIFKQYKVIDEKVVDENGKEHTVRIGFAGFMPPQILQWDKQHLEGKVQVKDIVESANEMVDVLRNKEKCDLVIGLAHSGYGHGDEAKYAENMSYQLTQVEGMDALVAGHAHQKFPAQEDRINGLPNTDVENGRINGMPTFMAGNSGSDLGLIDLKITKENGKWTVLSGTASLRDTNEVENDKDTEKFIKVWHDTTLEYINKPIGKVDQDLNSYFTLVRDSASLEVVNLAQFDFAKKLIEKKTPELEPYKDLPMLSNNAPFKAGKTADNYIDIKKGDLAIKDVSNLYKYSNNLVVTKLTGADVKNILELTATIYNTIDVNSKEEQELINPDFIPFNFNMFEGIDYEIDVTKEPRYTPAGEVIDMNNSRVVNITRDGKEIKDDEEFLVVTNSYLAGGALFKSFTPEKLIYNSGTESREIVANYLKEIGEFKVTQDNNWRIKPIEQDVNMVFTSNSNAVNYLGLDVNKNIEEVETLEEGLSKFRYNAKEEVVAEKKDSFAYVGIGAVLVGLIVFAGSILKKKKKK